MTRRLHIGGKEVKQGWEILDAIPAPHVNHVGNAADLSRFADGTFAELYASHVLEHFDFRRELRPVLREWRRVLRTGGSLYVSVPDLERLCHLYITPRISNDTRYDLMTMIFGAHIDEYDFHRTGFDESYLLRNLLDAGFTSVRRVHSFQLFQDTSEMEVVGMPISLNMIASNGDG